MYNWGEFRESIALILLKIKLNRSIFSRDFLSMLCKNERKMKNDICNYYNNLHPCYLTSENNVSITLLTRGTDIGLILLSKTLINVIILKHQCFAQNLKRNAPILGKRENVCTTPHAHNLSTIFIVTYI